MSRSSAELFGEPDQLSNWISGEMVIVIQLPKRPDEDKLDVLAEEVRTHLNMFLAPFNVVLELYGTHGRWRESQTMPPVRRRVFIFGLHRQQPLAALFFHVRSTGPDIGDPMPTTLSYLQSQLEQLAQSGLHVLSAMPNWLVLAAPACYGDGGPALPPRPAPALDLSAPGNPPVGWHISLTDPGISLDPQGAEDVMVAVLDTAHYRDRLHSAATRPEFRRNWLLQRLAVDLRDKNDLFEIEFDRYPLTSEVRTGRDLANDPRYYLMPDHGIFISGLVRDVAPRAQIRLVRILNDYGGSDLYTLFAALTDLEREVIAGSIRRLVINLSLTIMPDMRRIPYIWFDHKQWATTQLAGVTRILNHLEEGLRLLFESLAAQDILLVAAAGNDSMRTTKEGQKPRPPRTPARYEHILSVTSVNSNFQPSAFANSANIPPSTTGVATYGGDITGSINMNGLAIPDAVRGVYLSSLFPGGEKNATGWADWSGTSFSTAIISALGAHLMAQGWTASDVVNGFAQSTYQYADKLFGSPPDAPGLHSNIVRMQQRFELRLPTTP